MTTIRSVGGRRLCGSGRKAGELYLECGLTRGGDALENMLMDPPMPIERETFSVSPIGVNVFQDHEGVTHVLDWVGESHYPEVADFIEEARLKGVSRKVSHTAPIQGLTVESRLYLCHPRARVSNAASLTTPPGFTCPCRKGHTAQEGCLGLAWHAEPNAGDARRTLGDDSYSVKPALLEKPEFELAVFMVVPITSLTVIVSPDSQTMDERLRVARQSGIPVLLADE